MLQACVEAKEVGTKVTHGGLRFLGDHSLLKETDLYDNYMLIYVICNMICVILKTQCAKGQTAVSTKSGRKWIGRDAMW